MKWDDDLYKEEKWDIFEIVRYGLTQQHAENVSIKKLQDCIDALFDALTFTEMDKTMDNDQDTYQSPDPVRTRTAKIVLDKSTKITKGH